jgi:hypothetical protein
MVYSDLNEKALAFGEAHIRQVRGRAKTLTEKWEAKTVNVRTRIPTRFTGLSIEERRAALLDELRFEIDELETSLWNTQYHVNRLREFSADVSERERDRTFWQWQCRYHRKKIAEYTGTNPLSFVGEEVELKYGRE